MTSATSRHSLNATSPTSRAFPDRSSVAFVISGSPTATTRISAVRHNAGKSFVVERAIVTVALALLSVLLHSAAVAKSIDDPG